MKSAFVDGGVRLLRGRRVLVDLSFFSVAFIDSPSAVDRQLCCLGAFEAWRVLRLPALREFAAQHAAAAGADADLRAAAGVS